MLPLQVRHGTMEEILALESAKGAGASGGSAFSISLFAEKACRNCAARIARGWYSFSSSLIETVLFRHLTCVASGSRSKCGKHWFSQQESEAANMFFPPTSVDVEIHGNQWEAQEA